MLQIYDIFLLLPCLAKTRKNFCALLRPIGKFLLVLEPWNVTNGFAFVSVERPVKNDLQCFWDFAQMRKFPKQFFPRLPLEIAKVFHSHWQFLNQEPNSKKKIVANLLTFFMWGWASIQMQFGSGLFRVWPRLHFIWFLFRRAVGAKQTAKAQQKGICKGFICSYRMQCWGILGLWILNIVFEHLVYFSNLHNKYSCIDNI